MDTKAFYQYDLPKTLFPNKTNALIVEHGEPLLRAYIKKCFDPKEPSFSFLPQQRVHAAKHDLNLRRTVKLDPVADFYIYDIIHKHRKLLRSPHRAERVHFGYRFEGGTPISSTAAYKGFKTAIARFTKTYRYFISFDVASYFNSLYHHDLANWFHELGAKTSEYENFGQYLREINAGRSVDLLPQGLYPTKMVGNDFLRFVDSHHGLRCKQLLRFMDDFYLFSDDRSDIRHDFMLIQTLLGEKSLNLNPAKTSRVKASHTTIDTDIDKIKKKLLDRRRAFLASEYDDDDEAPVQILIKKPLSKQEMDYLVDLLGQESLEEEDAELILSVMRDHAQKVENKLDYIIRHFPNLMKAVNSFTLHVKDKEFLTELLIKLSESERLQEFQLFWFGHILEEQLLKTKKVSEVINALYNHKSATIISQAKLLEIDDKRFGLAELRDPLLRSGRSDWLSWSAAIGERSLKSSSRNHRLAYFSKGSNMNHLIAQVVGTL